MLPPRDPPDPPLFPQAGPSSPNRPSIFELLAEDQLRDLFHPVVRYVLSYFAQRHPRYLLKILNYHEEFFACLLLLIERHHLKKHNASVSQHFYQLHLVPAGRYPTPRSSALQPPRPLSRRQRWGMLLFLVGVPYIRARLQDYYERLARPRESDEPVRALPNSLTKSQRIFRAVYPYANLSYDLFLLVSDLRYLFDRTESYRPWHIWLGLRVERRDPDLEQNHSTSWTNSLPPLLPPLLLALKLSQWWYSPSSPRALTSTSDSSIMSKIHRAIAPPRPLPILPESGLLPSTPPSAPPTIPSDAAEPPDSSANVPRADHGFREDPPPPYEPLSGVAAKQEYSIDVDEYGHCPLCRKKWQNPAILPSGWVVCWRCGWDAIEGDDEDDAEEALAASAEQKTKPQNKMQRRRGKCPITGMDVGVGQLRRVLI